MHFSLLAGNERPMHACMIDAYENQVDLENAMNEQGEYESEFPPLVIYAVHGMLVRLLTRGHGVSVF